MTSPTRNPLGGLARGLAAAGLALAACLAVCGCAKVDIDATGYRKYWQPFVSPPPSDSDRGTDQLPDDPNGGEPGGPR
jgi:hypothetical protein